MHHFTVDVEEAFHAHAARPWVPRAGWEAQRRRSPEVIQQLLELLDTKGAKGTFFILGWLAEREPDMVRAIAAAGHEVASHGWGHRRVGEVSRSEFQASVRGTKDLLESLTGASVTGYRAPSFSIVPGLEWALDVLLEEGYEYDSSMYPVRVHPRYGYPRALPHPHLIRRAGGDIAEVPLSTVELFGRTLPAAGGAYGRFLPFSLIKRALRDAEARSSSATVYVHPWELDLQKGNAFFLPLLPRIRMTWGRKRAWRWIRDVLGRHEFRPVRETVARLKVKGPVHIESLSSRFPGAVRSTLRPSA